MAPVHSVSREHQLSNWLIRVLGLSIVVYSVFSIIQVGTVTTLTMGRDDKRVMRNGLMDDNGLVLAIGKSPDSMLDAPVQHRGAREDELYLAEEDLNLLASVTTTSTANAVSSGDTPATVDSPNEAPVVDSTADPTPEATVTPSPATTPSSTNAPETIAPEAEAPVTKAPNTKAPETKAPETKAPETKASGTKAASKRQNSASGSKKSPSKSAAPSSKASSKRGKPSSPKPTKRPIVPIPEAKVCAASGTKGIVMCLHDRIIPLGISLTRELRCLGNEEVIEMYHCSELSAESINLFHTVDSNTKVIDICSNLVAAGAMTSDFAETFKSYWVKPLAVHQTELEEIILLDADDILMKDPATLRQNRGYVEKGALFFYDRVVKQGEFFNRQYEPVKGKPQGQYLRHWLRKFDYARFNSTAGPSTHMLESFAYNGKTCHEQDSSMLLINKKDNAKAMSILWFLITEERFRYTFSWGGGQGSILALVRVLADALLLFALGRERRVLDVERRHGHPPEDALRQPRALRARRRRGARASLHQRQGARGPRAVQPQKPQEPAREPGVQHAADAHGAAPGPRLGRRARAGQAVPRVHDGARRDARARGAQAEPLAPPAALYGHLHKPPRAAADLQCPVERILQPPGTSAEGRDTQNK